jgi:cell division protease FtsH
MQQTNAAPVRKITIIPRTSGALGFTMQADEQEHVLMQKTDLLNQLEVLVAGRAAEELIFGTCTSGAANDIERATLIARQMITRFGMNEEIGLMALDTVIDPYLDPTLKSNCSPDAAALVEREMKKIIHAAYDHAIGILREHAPLLNRLAEYLLLHENITGEEMMRVAKDYEESVSREAADGELKESPTSGNVALS